METDIPISQQPAAKLVPEQSMVKNTPIPTNYDVILEELKAMAVNFTLYFEDIVSKVGLWHSFVAGHSNLYRKPLSFYRVGEDYTTDEIHSRIYSFSYGMPHLQARTLRHWSIWRTNPLPR